MWRPQAVVRGIGNTPRNVWITDTAPRLHRSFSIGVPSAAVPRGMQFFPLRDSTETVEAIADAYVNMDLQLMREFHELVAKGVPRPTGSALVSCEEMLLHGLAAGGCQGAGVGAPASVSSRAPADGCSASDVPVPKKVVEKAAVDINLKNYPAGSKVKLIKELRAVTGVTLQEAKLAVERCPGVMAKAIPRADAEKLKELLESHGAEVELL